MRSAITHKHRGCLFGHPKTPPGTTMHGGEEDEAEDNEPNTNTIVASEVQW